MKSLQVRTLKRRVLQLGYLLLLPVRKTQKYSPASKMIRKSVIIRNTNRVVRGILGNPGPRVDLLPSHLPFFFRQTSTQ